MRATGLDVGPEEVPRVRDQVDRLPQFDRQGLELCEHWFDWLLVVARRHGAGLDDQQIVHIHCKLAVVAWLIATPRNLHDAGFFMGAIASGLCHVHVLPGEQALCREQACPCPVIGPHAYPAWLGSRRVPVRTVRWHVVRS